jgi:hypothetical protein
MQKLTTAPKAARTPVLIKSDEPMFTTTVKAVPDTVPRVVPLTMLFSVGIPFGYPPFSLVSLLSVLTETTASV